MKTQSPGLTLGQGISRRKWLPCLPCFTHGRPLHLVEEDDPRSLRGQRTVGLLALERTYTTYYGCNFATQQASSPRTKVWVLGPLAPGRECSTCVHHLRPGLAVAREDAPQRPSHTASQCDVRKPRSLLWITSCFLKSYCLL